MRFSAILNFISASKGRTRGRIYQQHVAQKDTSLEKGKRNIGASL
jgi:hypothetical protein